jgi:GTPase SAR1 family protein
VWFFAFAGRMLYEIGEKDGWQCICYLLGVAGSGKSTITDMLIGNMYDREDVGVISNNCEPMWALSAVIKKFIWVSPEVKETFGLEQATFQSMVSGESVLVAEKFKTPYSTYFKKPGFMAGNVLPHWKDAAGSIKRRLIIFRFDRQVTKTDSRLGIRLQEELPKFIIKANKAYLEMAGKYGTENIWEVLPEEFKVASESSLSNLSILDSFMRSSNIVLEPGAKITVRKFKLCMKTYATENSFDDRTMFDNLHVNMMKFGAPVKRDQIIEDGVEVDEDCFLNVRFVETRRPVQDGFIRDDGGDDGV